MTSVADADQAVSGYAAAVLAAARAEGALDRVSDELYHVSRAIEGHAELSQRLADPSLDLPTKLSVVDGLLSGRAHPATTSAVMFVVQAGRGRQLQAIADAVVTQAAAERDHAVAEVRTAVPLDEERTERLTAALSQATGRNVDVKVTVDPGVIGGVVVKMADTVIDGSVERRLRELRAALTGA